MDTEELLAFDTARSRLLADVRRMGPERVAVADAAGRVLSEGLVAHEPLPRFDNSAMDGYAVATADLEGGGPFTLDVAGESSAGAEPPWLARGAACRIFTGAPVPERADAVIMQEHVTRDDDVVSFATRPRPGQNVRHAGEDLARDAVAIAARTRLTAGGLALAAMLGRSELTVSRRPVVTIVCTGDELRSAGDEARPASIPESNSAPLAALARQAGAVVRVAPITRDDPRATLRAIEQALDGTDLLLTVGGVSVGDHDVVRPALEQAGVTLDFWRVAIKPGKPIAFGRSARAAVLGCRATRDPSPCRSARASPPPASARPTAWSSCARCSSSTTGCSPRACTTTRGPARPPASRRPTGSRSSPRATVRSRPVTSSTSCGGATREHTPRACERIV